MKPRITLSVALVLSVVLLSLTSSDSTANAQQPPQRYRFDTGLIVPGPHILRITIATGSGDDKLTFVRFGRMEYMQGTCDSGGVCKHALSSQTLTDRIMLAPGEGATFDLTDGTSNTILGVRGVVESNRPNVTVTFQIISLTGEVTSHIIVANADPWGDN